MKRFLVAVIALVALAGWIIWNPPEDGGYLLIAFGSKTIEMSLWLAAFLLAAGLFILWIVWQLIWGGWRVAKDVSGFIFYGSSARAQKRTESGLIDFIEGNWNQAHKKLVRSAPRVQAPLINYLAAARSAHEMHDYVEVDRLLTYAAQTVADSELAIAITRARIELEHGNFDESLKLLTTLNDAAHLNPVVLDIQKNAYVAKGDWQSLRNIFDRLRRQRVESTNNLNNLEIQMYAALLQQSAHESEQALPSERLEKLHRLWNEIPSKLQRLPEITLAYAREQIKLGGDVTAEPLLRKAINRQWNDEMVKLYGQVQGRDLTEQMRIAEAWKVDQPSNAILLACLGRLSLRLSLWGKAKDYFRASIQLRKDPEIYMELARLGDYLGETEQAHQDYQAALAVSVGQLPVISLPKRQQS